jgi:tryptophanyl-tRNA synthetase
VATPFLNELREAVGLRSFVAQTQVAATTKKKAAKAARFVSFREEDGSFRFRLLAADGEQLLLSRNFADGKAAGAGDQAAAGGTCLDIRENRNMSFSVWLEGEHAWPTVRHSTIRQRNAIPRYRIALTPVQE